MRGAGRLECGTVLLVVLLYLLMLALLVGLSLTSARTLLLLSSNTQAREEAYQWAEAGLYEAAHTFPVEGLFRLFPDQSACLSGCDQTLAPLAKFDGLLPSRVARHLSVVRRHPQWSDGSHFRLPESAVTSARHSRWAVYEIRAVVGDHTMGNSTASLAAGMVVAQPIIGLGVGEP